MEPFKICGWEVCGEGGPPPTFVDGGVCMVPPPSPIRSCSGGFLTSSLGMPGKQETGLCLCSIAKHIFVITLANTRVFAMFVQHCKMYVVVTRSHNDILCNIVQLSHGLCYVPI